MEPCESAILILRTPVIRLHMTNMIGMVIFYDAFQQALGRPCISIFVSLATHRKMTIIKERALTAL